MQATRTIPVIFVLVADPVGSGYVASLPRPGGNVTGFTPIVASLGGKWTELLKEIAPRIARVTLVFNPSSALFIESYLNPSKPPLPPSAWRLLLRPLTTCLNSNCTRYQSGTRAK